MVTLNLNQVKQLLNEFSQTSGESITVTSTPDGKALAFYTEHPEYGSLVLDPAKQYTEFYGQGLFLALDELEGQDTFNDLLNEIRGSLNQTMSSTQADGFSEN